MSMRRCYPGQELVRWTGQTRKEALAWQSARTAAQDPNGRARGRLARAPAWTRPPPRTTCTRRDDAPLDFACSASRDADALRGAARVDAGAGPAVSSRGDDPREREFALGRGPLPRVRARV